MPRRGCRTCTEHSSRDHRKATVQSFALIAVERFRSVTVSREVVLNKTMSQHMCGDGARVAISAAASQPLRKHSEITTE